jgi:signal peptidase I
MNFALILFLFVIFTGVLWAINQFWARKRRPANAKDPWWVEYGGSFFPVILAVFMLRSFLVEPFKIPSGSMIPTLLVGDFILVNKFTYGIRLPIINKKIIELNKPKRGDVVVFRYPPDPSLDYIKRVVGLPGDRVVYHNKKLTINGQEVAYESAGDYLDPARLYYTPRFKETLGEVQHMVLIDPEAPGYVRPIVNFPGIDQCHYNSDGVSCQVPQGHYFVMGDNRDNSQDSRFWGFVPDNNLVGKAFFIWFNFSDLQRIGSFH